MVELFFYFMILFFTCRYDSLIGTIGKKFSTKRNRSTEDDPFDRISTPHSTGNKKKLKAEFMKPKD